MFRWVLNAERGYLIVDAVQPLEEHERLVRGQLQSDRSVASLLGVHERIVPGPGGEGKTSGPARTGDRVARVRAVQPLRREELLLPRPKGAALRLRLG